MVKKVFAIVLCLFCMNSMKAQTVTDATIAFEDIQYWVGSGSDSAVLIVNFGIPDTAFAWGYLFNGTATVQQMTDAITAADPRFWVVGLPSYYPEGDIFFVISTGDTLSLSGRDEDNPWNYWEANINGQVSYTGASQVLANGDVFKYGDQRAPSRVCLEEAGGWCLLSAWTKEPTAVSDPSAPSDPMPEDAAIDFSEILYWVGEGANSTVLAVNWADTALAWGYRFATDSVSVQSVMEAIAAADPRFSFSGEGWLDDIYFVEGGDTLKAITPGWWMSTLNGNSNASAGMITMLAANDFFKWGDYMVAVTVDTVTYAMVFPATVYPVSVPAVEMPEDATIDASQIVYWVGEGANKIVFAVNWADTALAWGYRFAADSVSVQSVMGAIAAADPRFSFSGEGWLDDIYFVEGGDTLKAITPGWWMSTLNGNSNASAGMTTMLAANDFFKWGDYMVAVTVDTVTYAMVFPMTVYPVSVPQTEGIATVDGVSMSVWPNPVADMVTVSGVNGVATLYDMRGSVVATYHVNGEARFDLSSVASGMYMLRVSDKVAKIVVRH